MLDEFPCSILLIVAADIFSSAKSPKRSTSTKYNGTERYTFEYDPNGNLTKETDLDNNQITSYTYDADNKIKTVNEGNNNTAEYQYDQNGNVIQRKHVAGSANIINGFTFDNINQLIKITENNLVRARFTYDETERLASRRNGDKTTSLYRYNGAGDLLQVVNYIETGEIIDSFSYTYNQKGNITSVTSNIGTTIYDYDQLEQLTKETRPNGDTIEYTYDEVGNRLTKKVTTGGTSTTTTYTYNDVNELTSVGGTTYTHDLNGNLTSDGSYSYVYDTEDRLIAVKQGVNTITSYTYRADGMRKTKTTAAGTITFHYDENKNVIYETNASNAIIASYTWNGIHPVSMTRGGTTYYYQLNGHGDVVALTTGTGTVAATYTYDAFGNIISETGTVENPYRYAGYCYDKEIGLYYLQARYYKPDIGRFLTLDPDPGDEDDSLTQNGYIYGDNNPVMKVDPDGNTSGLAIIGLGLGVSLGPLGWTLLTIAAGIATGLAIYTYTKSSTRKRRSKNKAKKKARSKDEIEPKVRSKEPIALRRHFSTRKKALDAVRRAGDGRYAKHPRIKGNGRKKNKPHFHPYKRGQKDHTHDHYYYPRRFHGGAKGV
ncbi:RHS repeat-associated core domain-containing protein [Seinonella peptonophila]|uniref:RHS repeat-associated core domain-containing protein n=1 Tax=Seinonella peptonophila TaxID=112248 RepID=A0A1M4Z7V2_9BACL|nr:RHS repeat-associated core domain-containing protein [Seinonella peptonophila]SHF14153.1 RHS repeat-associated core domain-containing protein [Seinonella peptonophila]